MNILVGGIPTPLKNMTSSVGMMLLRVDEQLKGEENGGNVGGPFSFKK